MDFKWTGKCLIVPKDHGYQDVLCDVLPFSLLPPPEYGHTLEKVIDCETDGDFALALHAMSKANKNEGHIVDMALAKKDARVCYLTFLMLFLKCFRSGIIFCRSFVFCRISSRQARNTKVSTSRSSLTSWRAVAGTSWPRVSIVWTWFWFWFWMQRSC